MLNYSTIPFLACVDESLRCAPSSSWCLWLISGSLLWSQRLKYARLAKDHPVSQGHRCVLSAHSTCPHRPGRAFEHSLGMSKTAILRALFSLIREDSDSNGIRCDLARPIVSQDLTDFSMGFSAHIDMIIIMYQGLCLLSSDGCSPLQVSTTFLCCGIKRPERLASMEQHPLTANNAK